MNQIFIIILIGGIAVAIQGQFMGLLDEGLGTKESVLLTYGLGGVVMFSYYLFVPASFNFKLSATHIPWYAFTAGLLGLVIVSSISYSIPRLGLARTFTILIAAQFIITALIEQFGWFGAQENTMSLSRLIGFIAIISGVWLVAKN